MRILILALAVATIAATTAAVKADPVEKPWTVKLGAGWPTQGQAKNDGGSTEFAAGVDYAPEKTTANNPALGSVYADYIGGTKSGGHLYSYGIGVAAKAYGTTPSGNTQTGASPYYGAGVGIYHTDDKDAGVSSNRTNLGAKLFAGLEFSGNYLVEVGYHFLPKANGADPSAFIASVGLRF